MKKQKQNHKIFYAILVLIPFIFFILLELSLNLFEYGDDTSTWTKITDEYYSLNPNVAKRYFSSVKNVPESIQDVFAIEKKENTYRIFVLGGSSAAGYPFMPLGSFSRYLRLRLEQNYPDKIIEVVNLALSAINSYTIRDLVPDVLEQNPDLILIYAGHNEYYGALGAGSMESLGKSRKIVNFVLSINNFKTVQLIRNILKGIIELVTSDNSSQSGTLMSRMAQNQQIEINSDTYNLGIEQFEGNFDDIVNLIKENNVPLILSTVASNLKDLPPFISGNGTARKAFKSATNAYNNSNFILADSLFRLAKDYDQLRFRAPEKINSIIKKLSSDYDVPFVDTDKILSESSSGNIIGHNLMTDHLHPTVEGYKDIGEIFYNKINELDLLPHSTSKYNYELQDSLTRLHYYFSKLDSTIGNYRLKALKNDWPFIRPEDAKPFSSIVKPNSFVDSLALKCVYKEKDWHNAHTDLANYYIKQNDLEKFINEMKVLIWQYPIISEYYEQLVSELVKQRDYNEAYEILLQNQKINETQFSNKWLGTISLSNKQYKSAVKYLERSLNFSKNDAQVFYNLAGAHSQIQDFAKALENIDKCLHLEPNYIGANNLRQQLQIALQQ